MGGPYLPLAEDQPALRLDGQPGYLRVHGINVFVRDQDQSKRFYLDKLGFSLMGDVRLGNGERWVAVAPPDGSTVLSLIAPKPESKEYEFIGRATHVVFVAEDVLAKYHEWRGRGVRFSYTPRLKRMIYERQAPDSTVHSTAHADHPPVWGGVVTHFKDPDGNSFALVSYDEESRAVEAQRRASAAKLESERRAAQELEIAKQVQMRLFPQTAPLLSTLDYSGTCLQAREVGGDYYDFLDLGRERLGLVVGDISGKGIAAALLMANLQANLRSQCAIASDQPHRFLRSLNRLFYENSTDSSYATLFFAEYDDRDRRLRYANCGHLPALLLRHDGALEHLDSTCMVLGLFPEWDCLTQECTLSAGDILALYTDGLTESFDDAGEEFGECRLVESVRRHREQPLSAMAHSIVDDVRKFSPHEQSDDITLIVAKCR
jgi:serine phosphatase RsbU (regulator of sigma subunit)